MQSIEKIKYSVYAYHLSDTNCYFPILIQQDYRIVG